MSVQQYFYRPSVIFYDLVEALYAAVGNVDVTKHDCHWQLTN